MHRTLEVQRIVHHYQRPMTSNRPKQSLSPSWSLLQPTSNQSPIPDPRSQLDVFLQPDPCYTLNEPFVTNLNSIQEAKLCMIHVQNRIS